MSEPSQPGPVLDKAAEENLVGACLLSTAAIETARERLEPADFFYAGLGTVFRTCCELLDRGDPVDVVTVSAALRTAGLLEEIGGDSRLHELGQIVPAVSNAAHYAKIVREASRSRYATAVALRLQDAARNGGISRHPEILSELEQLIDSPGGVTSLRPLWWHEALHEEIPETTEYVRDVLQTGVLADIVGLPYLHKTAIALELATKIARGNGRFLGEHEITRQANVGYFWADDSRAKELERIQAYSRIHELETLPIALYLNPGIVLPDDLPTVKAQIREHGLRLVVFDSLYNFCPGVDFTKDHAKVTSLYHALKRVCDQIEGLTIVVVDHAAKPSEGNRGRHSAHSSFGSIFKAASVRCTIAIEREGREKLFVSATGNNVRGFDRVPAYWSPESLEVRIVELTDERREELESTVEEMLRSEIFAWLRTHESDPKQRTTNSIRKGIRRGRGVVAGVIERLEREGLIEDQNAPGQLLESYPGAVGDRSGAVPAGTDPDLSRRRSGRGRAQSWRILLDPFIQADQVIPTESQDKSGAVIPGRSAEVASQLRPEPIPPVRGEGTGASAQRIGDPDDHDLPEV